EVTTVAAHASPVSVLSFSPDGELFASGGLDTTVKLWDTQTQELLNTYRGHLDRVVDLEFSRAGTTLRSAWFDGTFRASQPKPKPEAHVCRCIHSREAVCVGFSSEGRLFAMMTNSPAGDQATSRVDYDNSLANRVGLSDSPTGSHRDTLS